MDRATYDWLLDVGLAVVTLLEALTGEEEGGCPVTDDEGDTTSASLVALLHDDEEEAESLAEGLLMLRDDLDKLRAEVVRVLVLAEVAEPISHGWPATQHSSANRTTAQGGRPGATGGTPMARKIHLTQPEPEDGLVPIGDPRTACGEPTKRRSVTDDPGDVSCPDCIISVGGVPAQADQGEADDDRPAATATPEALTERLEGDALIARKRLAGAGRKAEAGTAFGSKWTDAERANLTRLFEETGWNRAKTAEAFVERYPHRTEQGAIYQIDRNLTKPTGS